MIRWPLREKNFEIPAAEHASESTFKQKLNESARLHARESIIVRDEIDFTIGL